MSTPIYLENPKALKTESNLQEITSLYTTLFSPAPSTLNDVKILRKSTACPQHGATSQGQYTSQQPRRSIFSPVVNGLKSPPFARQARREYLGVDKFIIIMQSLTTCRSRRNGRTSDESLGGSRAGGVVGTAVRNGPIAWEAGGRNSLPEWD